MKLDFTPNAPEGELPIASPPWQDLDVPSSDEILENFAELEASLDVYLAALRTRSPEIGNRRNYGIAASRLAKPSIAVELVFLARIVLTSDNDWDTKYFAVLLRELRTMVAPGGWR